MMGHSLRGPLRKHPAILQRGTRRIRSLGQPSRERSWPAQLGTDTGLEQLRIVRQAELGSGGTRSLAAVICPLPPS